MRLKKLAAGAALTLACLAAGVPAAFAATADGPAIVPSRAGELTVYCQRDVDGKSVPIEGQELELYLVASYNADGNLETEEYFADVLTDPETELQDVSTAEILSPLLSDAEKRPDPAASGTTDANGMARWTINDGESGLPLGCYLVYGTDDLSKAVIVTDGGTDKYYFPQTILVPVPYLAGEGEEAFYDYVPAAYPKPVLITPPEHDPPAKKVFPDETSRNALKDKTFEVVMKAVSPEDAPMPNGTEGTSVTTEIPGDGTEVEIGIIKFMLPGTYKYEVTEVNQGEAGVEYDDTVYTVTYEVTFDREAGTMDAVRTYTKNGEEVGEMTFEFSNVYKEEPTEPTETEPTEPTETEPTEPTETEPTEPTETEPTEPTETEESTEESTEKPTRGGGGGGGGGGGHKSGGDPGHGPGVETTASGDPGSSVTDQPDAGPGGSGGPGDVSRTSVLPKTGLLWWPVPLLAVLGVFFLVLGFALSRREKEQRRKA